jgi:spermidine dehydrogenase
MSEISRRDFLNGTALAIAAYVANSLFDGDGYDKVIERARARVGRVAIANSDAGGDAYAHLAIDQAARAVRELTG